MADIIKNDCQGEGPEFVERAHKDKLKADLLDKIADAISNEWSAKPGWHLHCAAAALTAIEDAGCVIAPKEPMRSEDVFTGDDVENIAEWQEWASRTGNDQLAGMLRHWWKKAQKTAEALRSLKRTDKTESDNGGCQAKSTAVGDTVSAPMEPLHSDIIAEAVRNVSWKPDKLYGYRDETGRIFVSADGQPIMDFPAHIALKLGEALVTLAANSQSSIEEPERSAGDTERAANAEGTLTPQNNQEADNG